MPRLVPLVVLAVLAALTLGLPAPALASPAASSAIGALDCTDPNPSICPPPPPIETRQQMDARHRQEAAALRAEHQQADATLAAVQRQARIDFEAAARADQAAFAADQRAARAAFLAGNPTQAERRAFEAAQRAEALAFATAARVARASFVADQEEAKRALDAAQAVEWADLLARHRQEQAARASR